MARIAAGEPDRRRGGADSSEAGQSPFTAAGQTSPWVALIGEFNFMAGTGGTGGTVELQASFDGGTTAVSVARTDGSTTPYTAPIVGRVLATQELGVLYRLRCVALSSGSMPWRISQ